MNLIKNIIIGSLVGLTQIIPGASFGTILLILGVYKKFVDGINDIVRVGLNTLKRITKPKNKKDFIHAIPDAVVEVWKLQKDFLIPVGIFAVIAIYIGSKIFYDMNEAQKRVRDTVFLGLTIASFLIVLIDIIKENKENKDKKDVKVKNNNILKVLKKSIPGIITFLFLMVIYKLKLDNVIAVKTIDQVGLLTIIPAIIVGIIGAVAMVFPGISGSLVITVLGYYDMMTGSIKEFKILFILPFIVGVVLGMIYASKLVKMLLEKHRDETNFAIIGFLVGSVVLMLPEIPNVPEKGQVITTYIIATIAGIVIGFGIKYLGKVFSKNSEKENK